MTWGDIDGTPLRLDADDDIHVEPVTAGPQFKVPEPAKRDELGRDMAQRARHSLQRKIQARMRTPSRSPMGTPGAFGKRGGQTPMSPAARRLASSLHGRWAVLLSLICLALKGLLFLEHSVSFETGCRALLLLSACITQCWLNFICTLIAHDVFAADLAGRIPLVKRADMLDRQF